MNKVIVPNDRTSKQPVQCYCLNPACKEQSSDDRFEFEFEHGQIACPKCGATEPPVVGVLSLVHLLQRAKEGRIVGSMGIRYQVACDPKRSHLATTTNLEAATDQIEHTNCPGCLKAAFEQKLPRQQGLIVMPSA